MDRLRKAVQIASAELSQNDSQDQTRDLGKTAIAEFLECQFRQRGGEKPAFDTIVASGFGPPYPMEPPPKRDWQRGETVVIDFGARFQGYHSDETKTLILGKPDAKTKRIYEIVRRAQAKAIQAVRPGVTGRDDRRRGARSHSKGRIRKILRAWHRTRSRVGGSRGSR